MPAQIGYSRGADGLVVRHEINKINDLKGKIVATAQFTEVDFFIRYLAQEAGLAVQPLGSIDATPDPEKINLIYTEDGFSAVVPVSTAVIPARSVSTESPFQSPELRKDNSPASS